MEQEKHKQLAAQLRKPTGDMGLEVADFMNAGNMLLNRHTIEQIENKPDLNVVEVGMANGKFIPELFNMYSIQNYHGCDFSADMVESAAQLNKDRVAKNQVHFHHASADNLPIPPRTIDALFTVNTIYFWEDADQTLNEFHRVLKENGQVIIGLRPGHLMKHYPFVQHGFKIFSAEDVVELLQKNGFDHVQQAIFQEPDFENDGLTFQVQSLVVSATKA